MKKLALYVIFVVLGPLAAIFFACGRWSRSPDHITIFEHAGEAK
jgi:hypothetical protein